MRINYLKLFVLVFSLSFLFAFAAPLKAGAQTKFSGVKNVMVLDFSDKTGKFDGKKVADNIRKEMAGQTKFNVVPKATMLARFKKLKINRTSMLKASYRKTVARHLKGVDAFITGTITKNVNYKLTLKMEKTKTQAIVHTSYILFKKEVGPNASRIACSKFLGVTPPAAVGVARQPSYEYAPIAPTPPPEIEPPAALAKPYRAMPSEEEAPPSLPTAQEMGKETKIEKQAEASLEEGEGAKRDWLTVKFSPAFLKNSYLVTNPAGSAVTNLISINTGFFPNTNVGADLWFLSFLGIDFGFNYGFLTLRVTPSGGTEESVSTKLLQFGGGLKYRYFFMSTPRSPYAFARIGYGYQKFSPGTQTTPILSTNVYKDVNFGIGANVPFWFLEKPDIGLNFGFDYDISSKLSESVVNNGTANSASGYQFAVGLYWKFYKALFAGFDYTYNHHGATFAAPDTALGSRTDVADGAKSSDNFSGIFISFGANM